MWLLSAPVENIFVVFSSWRAIPTVTRYKTIFPQGFQVWRIDLAPANRSFSSCSIPANAMHDGLYDTNPLQLERHGLPCSTIFARLCREVNVCNVRRLALCSDYIILNFLRLTALQCLIFVPHILGYKVLVWPLSGKYMTRWFNQTALLPV